MPRHCVILFSRTRRIWLSQHMYERSICSVRSGTGGFHRPTLYSRLSSTRHASPVFLHAEQCQTRGYDTRFAYACATSGRALCFAAKQTSKQFAGSLSAFRHLPFSPDIFLHFILFQWPAIPTLMHAKQAASYRVYTPARVLSDLLPPEAHIRPGLKPTSYAV